MNTVITSEQKRGLIKILTLIELKKAYTTAYLLYKQHKALGCTFVMAIPLIEDRLKNHPSSAGRFLQSLLLVLNNQLLREQLPDDIEFNLFKDIFSLHKKAYSNVDAKDWENTYQEALKLSYKYNLNIVDDLLKVMYNDLYYRNKI